MIERLIPETKLRLLELLRGGPRSVDELAHGLGVTPPAVRQQITPMCNVGVVEYRRIPSSGRGGRPRHIYRLSASAASELRLLDAPTQPREVARV